MIAAQNTHGFAGLGPVLFGRLRYLPGQASLHKRGMFRMTCKRRHCSQLLGAGNLRFAPFLGRLFGDDQSRSEVGDTQNMLLQRQLELLNCIAPLRLVLNEQAGAQLLDAIFQSARWHWATHGRGERGNLSIPEQPQTFDTEQSLEAGRRVL
jgi:hypothetical protein